MDSKDITIQKNTYTIPQPYDEGHVLSAIEAKVLNQTWTEGVRNNMSPKVKKAIEAAEAGDETAMKTVTKEVKDYAATYVFTAGGTGRTKLDPIEKEARRIALSAIKANFAATGRSIKEFTSTPEGKEKLAIAVASIAEKPEILKSAKKRVEEQNKVVSDALEGLDLG